MATFDRLLRPWVALLAGACALPAGLTSAASPPAGLRCTLVADGGATVHAQGLAVPLPATLADCGQASVSGGRVTACLADARGQPVCRSFGPGEAIDAGRFGDVGHGTVLPALDRLLRASPGAMAGRPRGADPLLPSKTVLLLDGQLLVDFSEPDMQGVEFVEIRRDSVDGPLLVRAARSPGAAVIEAGTLTQGPDYWAVLVPASRPTQAPKRFSVAPPQEQQAVRAKLGAFDRQQAGPLATAMMRAAWLAQENYDYDALVTMKAVGLRLR